MVTPYINFDYVNEQADQYEKNIHNNEFNKDEIFPLFKLKSIHNNNEIYFNKITEYLNKNLDNILSSIQFPKEKNGSYIYSWQGNEGEISYIYDSKPVIEYLKQNKQQIIGNEKINWNNIIDQYIKTNDFRQFGKKIREYIINKNNIIIKQRANYLEQLDDKVNDCIKIDYNPASDHERDKPIVILRIKLNNKIQDKLYIGKVGQSHGGLITSIIIPDLVSIHARVPEPATIYQAYLLGTIAFMDPNMKNTYNDIELVKKILINDDRITKIYTVPNELTQSGNIVRVAKNEKLNLGVDIDNCLNNLNVHLLKLIKKYYKVKIDESIYDIWDKLGISDKEKISFLTKHQDELQLDIEQHCRYYLRKLQNLYNIYIITARPYSFAKETIYWLDRNNIPYDEIYFRAGNKVDACKFLNIKYMIDDSPWNILSLQKNEIPCLIYDRPYNQRIKNNQFVNRVYSWKDIYKFLIEDI